MTVHLQGLVMVTQFSGHGGVRLKAGLSDGGGLLQLKPLYVVLCLFKLCVGSRRHPSSLQDTRPELSAVPLG